MYEKYSVKANILKKKDVLDNPEKYRDRNIMMVEVYGRYVDNLIRYYKYNVHKNGDIKTQRVTFANWEDTWSDEAKNFMFAMRDKLAKAQGDTTRENKDHLYRSAKAVCGLTEGDDPVSLSDLSRAEMVMLINQFLEWLAEAEEPVDDILSQYKELMKYDSE